MALWMVSLARDAENVVVGAGELLGDDGAGRHVVHDRNFGFLVEALAGERDAGVDVADGGDDLLFVDQLLRDLHAEFVLGLVVALDEQDRPLLAADITPPAALISSAASFTPSRMHTPIDDEPPVNGPESPILMGSSARATPAVNKVAATAPISLKWRLLRRCDAAVM